MENSNRPDWNGSFADFDRGGEPRDSHAFEKTFSLILRVGLLLYPLLSSVDDRNSGVLSPCEASFLCLLARSPELSTRLPQIREYSCHGKNCSLFPSLFSFPPFFFSQLEFGTLHVPSASVYVCLSVCARRPSSLSELTHG